MAAGAADGAVGEPHATALNASAATGSNAVRAQRLPLGANLIAGP
jgi:hypothetical protein